MPDLVNAVRRRIADAGDPAKAPRMQAYMKSELPFRGVTSVPLRSLLRGVLAEHPLGDRSSWVSAVHELWDEAEFREERYAALALARHRLYREHQDPRTLDLYRHLVVTGAWWDLVDDLASHHVGDVVRTNPTETIPLMRRWALDDDLWVRRTALLCQLRSKDATDPDLLAHALESNLEPSLHGREFFIRKACGWSLREFAKTDPSWVRSFVAEHDDRLSGLSRREALKHLS